VELRTVGDKLFWSYANLGMQHAALSEGASRIERRHYLIRSRLWRQLSKGGMPRSLADDERLKLVLPQACSYCGSTDRANFSVDQLLPRHRGGADRGENFVWACRSCNSARRDRDVLDWLASQGRFPPILLLRRYLKLRRFGAARRCHPRRGGARLPADAGPLREGYRAFFGAEPGGTGALTSNFARRVREASSGAPRIAKALPIPSTSEEIPAAMMRLRRRLFGSLRCGDDSASGRAMTGEV
jgi:hypothetical protein